MARTESGFLLIADITGYTSYLSHSELEHAQETLAALLELLIDQTRPPLQISSLAGDAVISYAVASRPVKGQAFVEMLENTYVAFRRAIEQMVLNTTCECNACANIKALDLKFFVHWGSFSVQRLEGREELIGHDVNKIFRMTKNDVVDQTGISAYTMYTEAAVQALELDGFTGSLVPHEGEYADIGHLSAWVQDMHPVWENNKRSASPSIRPKDVIVRSERDLPVPPEVAWDYLTRPEFRTLLLLVDSQKIHNRRDGRVGTGTVFECFHGNGKPLLQTVLEWHPFDTIVTEDLTPIKGATIFAHTDLRAKGDDHSSLVYTVTNGRGSPLRLRLMRMVASRVIPKSLAKGMDALAAAVTADIEEGVVSIPERVEVSSSKIEEAAAAALAGD